MISSRSREWLDPHSADLEELSIQGQKLSYLNESCTMRDYLHDPKRRYERSQILERVSANKAKEDSIDEDSLLREFNKTSSLRFFRFASYADTKLFVSYAKGVGLGLDEELEIAVERYMDDGEFLLMLYHEEYKILAYAKQFKFSSLNELPVLEQDKETLIERQGYQFAGLHLEAEEKGEAELLRLPEQGLIYFRFKTFVEAAESYFLFNTILSLEGQSYEGKIAKDKRPANDFAKEAYTLDLSEQQYLRLREKMTTLPSFIVEEKEDSHKKTRALYESLMQQTAARYPGIFHKTNIKPLELDDGYDSDEEEVTTLKIHHAVPTIRL